MIRSFYDRDTEKLFQGKTVRKWQAFARQAEKRLRILDAADTLRALAMLPSNHLESLKKDRRGQHSIRINDQWRVCFVWRKDGAYRVEITDYH
jgi:proteic killer suppression protein